MIAPSTIGAALAGLIGWAGLPYGKQREREATHGSWLRDQRLNAYADLTSSAFQILESLPSLSENESTRMLPVGTFSTERAASRIYLLGPDHVAVKASGLSAHLRELATFIENDFDGTERELGLVRQRLETAERALMDFSTAARHALAQN